MIKSNASTKPKIRDLPPLERFGKTTKIPYSDGFDFREMAVLKDGLRPESASDKWTSFFKRKTLYLHRARTGKGVYQLKFKINNDGSGEVRWAKACKDIIVIDKHYEAALLDFLIAHVLLGHDIEFPRHIKVDQNKPGQFQNTIAGTDCPEIEVTTKMIKGQFK